MKIIAIKDQATETFNSVHTVRHVGQATRDFTDAVNDPQNKQLHQHPEDFELWQLGDLDESTGTITPNATRIVRALDVKRTA